MKKLTLLLVVATGYVSAFVGQVKKGDMTISVNGQDKALKKADSISLKGGDIICYVNGDGRLVIKDEGYKKQLSKKSSPCRKLPVQGTQSDNVHVGDLIASVFEKTEEQSVDGVSRKGGEVKEEKITLALKPNQKYILLENDAWGPMPIELTVYDEKGNVVKEMEYNDTNDLKTSFLIPVSSVKNGYTLKVTDGFGDVLAVVSIKK